MPEVLTPERITIITMLLLAIGAGARKVWVWGYQLTEAQAAIAILKAEHKTELDEVKADAKEWKGIAIEQWRTTKGAVAVAETIMTGRTP
jgi:hypothetical protein